VKKGRKPREKKTIKKMIKEIATKDNTPSSSVPTSIFGAPPFIVPHPIFKVIDMARSHCPPPLMSLSMDIFASSEYIARSTIQLDRHGIEPQALILPSSIFVMLSVKKKTGKNAPIWDQMLDFAKKVKSMLSSLVLILSFNYTLSYKYEIAIHSYI